MLKYYYCLTERIFSFFFYFEAEKYQKNKKSKNDDSLIFSISFPLSHKMKQKNNAKILLLHNNKNILKYTIFKPQNSKCFFLLYQNW